MTVTTFGLVGAGAIGSVHARNLVANPRTRLAWVVDADAGRGEALARGCGARHAPTLAPMLADDAVDAVIVASSTDVHAEHVLACVAARKAVLCEKPVADSLDGARRCLDAARAAGVPAAVGFNRRFDVHHAAVHGQVRAGAIGAVESIHIVSRSFEATPPAAAHRAGGMLREKGTHFYDLAYWLAASEPVEVYAAGGCLFDPGYAAFGDVDSAALTLRFASGALATFSFSRRTTYGYDETIEVFGAQGMLESRRQRELGVALWRGPSVTEGGLHADWFRRFAPTYAAELERFVDALRDGTPMSPDLADGLRAQAVAEAARESLVAGAPVRIEPVWR